MTTLPFEPLVSQLRGEGFSIGVDSWLRLASLLEKCDGGIDPSRLRTMLCPLFATNPEEQKRFGEIFDHYYPLVAKPESGPAPAVAPAGGQQPSRRKWYVRIAIAAALLCILGLGLTWQIRKRSNSGGNGEAESGILRAKKTDNTPGSSPATGSPTAGTPERDRLIQVKATPVDASALDRLRELWLIPALLAGLYAVWYLARRFWGGYLVRQRGEGAVSSWSRALAVRAPIARAPEVSQNVRRLRQRVIIPSNRLDLRQTLQATIRNAGYPKVRFASGTRRSEYLVLIDRVSSRDHQSELFNQLVTTLREKGQLAVEQYFFTRDPRVCVSAKTGKAIYLADLLPRFPSHRLLMFGDGAALWNSMTGERPGWTDMLFDRPQTALLTPNAGPWDAREHALSAWTEVQPATLEGLSRVLDAFEERPDRGKPQAIAVACPEYPAVESRERVARYVDGLREYLGDQFDLSCACALYPRLEWDLTLHLAAALDPALPDHAKLLKLAGLPWFRAGFYPVALQEQLFRRLSKDQRQRLRRKIVGLMEAGNAAAVQHASLELIVQQFDLSPAERQRLESKDVFARLSMTGGRSRMALWIPEALRRGLFRFGVPAFGLRWWVSACLAGAALAGVSAAAVVLPPLGRLDVNQTVPAPPADWAVLGPKPPEEFPPSPFKPGGTGYTVPQVAQLYNFPTEFDGTGQTIAVIELGGGYRDSDLDAYFNGLKIHKPKVTWVGVDGAKNAPTDPSGADSQVVGDIEVAGAVAPGAQIVVYFGANTSQGFLNAIAAAINSRGRKNSVISIGWGGAEDGSASGYTPQILQAVNNVLQTASYTGITICVSAGDNGATDGLKDGKPHAVFPASSPWVLAVGGTSLVSTGGKIRSEVAWNTSGGGVSTVFPLPDWQKNVKVPLIPNVSAGRGLPDVAANADPKTGFLVYVDGQEIQLAGTSIAAPFWAGLIALLNQALGHNVGFLNPVLYQKLGPAGVLRSITQGDNRVGGIGYSAGPGWNPVTGWGSPDGRKMLQALRSSAKR